MCLKKKKKKKKVRHACRSMYMIVLVVMSESYSHQLIMWWPSNVIHVLPQSYSLFSVIMIELGWVWSDDPQESMKLFTPPPPESGALFSVRLSMSVFMRRFLWHFMCASTATVFNAKKRNRCHYESIYVISIRRSAQSGTSIIEHT